MSNYPLTIKIVVRIGDLERSVSVETHAYTHEQINELVRGLFAGIDAPLPAAGGTTKCE